MKAVVALISQFVSQIGYSIYYQIRFVKNLKANIKERAACLAPIGIACS